MVDAIVSFAVQKLGDFLGEVGHLQAVRDDVEWLREELRWMQSFIKDAEGNQGGDNRLQNWIYDISNVAYEAVDVLETFSLKVEGGEAPRGGIFDHIKAWAKIPNKKANLYNIGKEIKSLREKLQEISRRRKSYGIRNFSNGGQGSSSGLTNKLTRTLRKTAFYVRKHHAVVGFEDEANKLLVELLKEEPQRCVVSIYGMGGLGKTTLAQKLYNSHQIRRKFDGQAWVCVSQEYRTEDLLRSIIKSFNRPSTREEFEMIEKMTEEDLEWYLLKSLRGCKYLVVLDDVWDKEAWKILRRAFPDSNNGSRVIITTRNKAIAIAADDRTFVHKLQFLRTEESWDLFCRKAFPAGDRGVNYRSPAKEELGREMVGKCAGLPLAIIVLGGLLFHKKQLQEWYKMKEHIWRHLSNDSIEITQLLSLSYYDLAIRMRPCFLYLGMFPEDYNIDARKLMFLWMAEEFIPQEEGIRMEDVAEEYLNELINRSLIQVTKRRGRRITRCKVHDLLRDLAVKKAREENFFDIHDPRKYSASQLLHCRRLAIHSHILNYFSLDHSNSRLRSLLVFNPDDESLNTMQLESICTNLKSLRVLDLQRVTVPNTPLPDVIGELIHLKFLGLPQTYIAKLPPSIGNLKSLQFLEGLNNHRCILPTEIRKLKQLRHIIASLMWQSRLETLTNLQTLPSVSYEHWLEIDTVNLINLRELGIDRISKLGRAPCYSLESVTELESLEELSLDSYFEELPPLQPLSSCQHLLELHLRGRIETLASTNELPQRLEVLILMETKLEEDPMPTLERLPNLRILYLLSESYNGKKMVCSAGGFCQLERIILHDLREFEEWRLEKGAMPIIRASHMTRCPKLKKLPKKLISVMGSQEGIHEPEGDWRY